MLLGIARKRLPTMPDFDPFCSPVHCPASKARTSSTPSADRDALLDPPFLLLSPQDSIVISGFLEHNGQYLRYHCDTLTISDPTLLLYDFQKHNLSYLQEFRH